MGVLLSIMLVASPSVGEIAPDFIVKDTEGRVRSLPRMLERGPVVMVFFPKAFTHD